MQIDCQFGITFAVLLIKIFMSRYDSLISKIQDRYNPEHNREISLRVNSELSGIDKEVARYVKMAMNEVDQRYTQITLEAGENVKQHLKDNQIGIDYRYQGSVMTRTHIRGASDIDLLTITGKFNDTDLSKVTNILNSPYPLYNYWEMDKLKRWKNSFSRYQGDANADLRILRLDDENILKRFYSQCDTSKPKSIKVTNLHYHRDVDVVVASWHDSVDFIRGLGEEYRGIQIYNKDTNQRIGPDFPFLSISRINSRSSITGGRLKKMIRFLKNVRTDSDNNITLTSFEINAICYDIPVNDYCNLHYLELVKILWLKLYHLCTNEKEANELKSVDGTEYIFRNNHQKLDELKKLHSEVWNIYQEIEK